MNDALFILLIIAVVGVIVLIAHFQKDAYKTSSAYIFLSNKSTELRSTLQTLRLKNGESEEAKADLAKAEKEYDAVAARIETFAQMREIMDLFASHPNLDRLVGRKKFISWLYWTISILLFITTAGIVFLFAFHAYNETDLWIRTADRLRGGLTEVILITLPLTYSLLLALLFMRFHNRAEGDLAPLAMERLRWSVIYKILLAAELANTTEPAKNLVIETFDRLRGAALNDLLKDQSTKDSILNSPDSSIPIDVPILGAIGKVLRELLVLGRTTNT